MNDIAGDMRKIALPMNDPSWVDQLPCRSAINSEHHIQVNLMNRRRFITVAALATGAFAGLPLHAQESAKRARPAFGSRLEAPRAALCRLIILASVVKPLNWPIRLILPRTTTNWSRCSRRWLPKASCGWAATPVNFAGGGRQPQTNRRSCQLPLMVPTTGCRIRSRRLNRWRLTGWRNFCRRRVGRRFTA